MAPSFWGDFLHQFLLHTAFLNGPFIALFLSGVTNGNLLTFLLINSFTAGYVVFNLRDKIVYSLQSKT